MFSDQDKVTSIRAWTPDSDASFKKVAVLLSPCEGKTKLSFLQVAWLLDEGLELEARDKDEVTPLHCAVFYMQRAVIKVLLQRGADIGTKDNQVPFTTLVHVIKYRLSSAVLYLF